MMDHVIAWGLLGAAFFAPILLLAVWRNHKARHNWGFKGDGGDTDVERARAMGHSGGLWGGPGDGSGGWG